MLGYMIVPYRYKIFMRQNPSVERLLQRVKFMVFPNPKRVSGIIVTKFHSVDRFFTLLSGHQVVLQYDNMDVPKLTVALDDHLIFRFDPLFPFVTYLFMHGSVVKLGLAVLLASVTRRNGKRKANNQQDC